MYKGSRNGITLGNIYLLFASLFAISMKRKVILSYFWREIGPFLQLEKNRTILFSSSLSWKSKKCSVKRKKSGCCKKEKNRPRENHQLRLQGRQQRQARLPSYVQGEGISAKFIFLILEIRYHTQTTQIPPRLDQKLVGLVLSLKLRIPS